MQADAKLVKLFFEERNHSWRHGNYKVRFNLYGKKVFINPTLRSIWKYIEAHAMAWYLNSERGYTLRMMAVLGKILKIFLETEGIEETRGYFLRFGYHKKFNHIHRLFFSHLTFLLSSPCPLPIFHKILTWGMSNC